MSQYDAAHNIASDATAAATPAAASAERARRIVKTMETIVAQQQCLPPPGEALPTQPLACETCGETFARKKALVRHQRANRCFCRERARAAFQKTNAPPETIAEAIPPPATPAPAPGLPCETCGDRFRRKKALVAHQRASRCFWRERARAAYQQAVANSHFADSFDEYVANILARPAPTDSVPPQGASSGHVCSSCGRRLGSRQALAKHIRLRRCIDHPLSVGNRAILAGRASVGKRSAAAASATTTAASDSVAATPTSIAAAPTTPTPRTIVTAPLIVANANINAATSVSFAEALQTAHATQPPASRKLGASAARKRSDSEAEQAARAQAQRLLASIKSSGLFTNDYELKRRDGSVYTCATPPSSSLSDKTGIIKLQLELIDDAAIAYGED